MFDEESGESELQLGGLGRYSDDYTLMIKYLDDKVIR
jgi:hypothetical protein